MLHFAQLQPRGILAGKVTQNGNMRYAGTSFMQRFCVLLFRTCDFFYHDVLYQGLFCHDQVSSDIFFAFFNL